MNIWGETKEDKLHGFAVVHHPEEGLVYCCHKEDKFHGVRYYPARKKYMLYEDHQFVMNLTYDQIDQMRSGKLNVCSLFKKPENRASTIEDPVPDESFLRSSKKGVRM